jgi:hypothetical protein
VNVLQRRMFAAGDVAASKQNILPLYEKHAKGNPIVDDRGMDPIFDSFLDRYGISPAQYAEIHQKAGNRVIYDPGLKPVTPFLDLFAGKTALKGIGNLLLNRGMKETGEYAAVKATGNMGPPLVTPIMKPSTTLSAPGRSAATAVSLPLISGAAAVPQDDEDEEAPLVALDQTQVELDKIKTEAEAKAKSEAEKAKADKVKTKQEIDNINSILKVLDLKDEKDKEAFIQKRKERKNRNTGIFLNEMAKAAAGTDNLADAIAIGAANSSDAVMKADEAEELAFAELAEKLAEEGKRDLKESDKLNIARDYSEKVGEIDGNNILISEVSQLRGLLAGNDVAGLRGWMNRLATKAEGFIGSDLELRNAQQVSNIGKFLQARMVQALLDEKGKTISDADRKLVADLLGDLDSSTSNRASILDKLKLIEATLRKSKGDAERTIKFYDAEYKDLIPNLSVFSPTAYLSEDDAEDQEVSIADREDVIK